MHIAGAFLLELSICFTRVSASVKTAFAFSLVWCHNACVHTLACIYYDVFRVPLFMGSQCMRFTRLSASIKTDFAFSLVLCHIACVSHDCRHQLRRLLRFSSYCVTMHAFHTRVCIG